MACRKSIIRTGKEEALPASIRFGEKGLILMEYTGWFDVKRYVGAVTQTVYSFGLFRRKGYVDSRDVEALLNYREDGFCVFKKV